LHENPGYPVFNPFSTQEEKGRPWHSRIKKEEGRIIKEGKLHSLPDDCGQDVIQKKTYTVRKGCLRPQNHRQKKEAEEKENPLMPARAIVRKKKTTAYGNLVKETGGFTFS